MHVYEPITPFINVHTPHDCHVGTIGDESFFRSIWECLHTNISVSKVIPIADHTDLLKTLLYKTIDIACSHGTHLLNLKVCIHLAGHIPFSH